MIPTTDQMDSTTPEDRRSLVGMCGDCGEWTHYDMRDGFSCENCGSKKKQSIISARTFDADRAKKESAKYMKGKKR